MKKLIFIFLALSAFSSYGQATFDEGVQITGGQPTVTTTPFITSTASDGLQTKILGQNIPISQIPTNYTPSTPTIGGHLSGIDIAIGTVTDALNEYSNFKPASTITDDGLYNAFPSIEKASNGDLLTVYRKGVAHLTFDGSIRLKRSTDNGKTWNSESTIITGGGHDYRDPSIARLANGNLILSYFDRITDSNILIYTSISTDNGVTFGTPIQLTGYADYGAVSSKVIQLTNGDLLLSTYGKSGANGLLNVFKSTNNGTSWSVLSTISTDVFGVGLKYTEPSLILAPNGDIIATIRGNITFQVARSISTDSGATWSALTDKFEGNSRAAMFYSNNVLYTNYRGTDGNAYIRFSSDSGVTFGSAIKLSSNKLGEQDEYSGVTLIKNNVFAYVYSTQNSTATSSYIKLRYLNDPISMGDIPFFQTEGFNSTGSVSVAGSLFTNNILRLSDVDFTISTNTVNTASGIVLRTGNIDRVNILGTGFVGLGITPTQKLDVSGNIKASGIIYSPTVSTQFVNSNSSSGILKLVGGATNYGGSIDIVGSSFGANNGGINFRTGIVAGESPIVASFNSSGLFNVVGNITANAATAANHVVIKSQLDLKADLASPALTGVPTAPTASAGTNTTQIATTAFVQTQINAKADNLLTGYVSGAGTVASTDTVLQGIQKLNGNDALKANLTNPTFITGITTPAVNVSGQTASTIALFDASKNIVSASTATYPSLTEFSYVKGVTGAINTTYAPIASPTFTGNPTAPTATAGTNTTQIATTAFVTGAIATAVPYKSYTAILTQTGTSAPVATVLQNTLGGTPVWTRTSTGLYAATLTGFFTANKTALFASVQYYGAAVSPLYTGTDRIGIQTFITSTGVLSDNINGATIEIRVYN